MHSMLRYIIVAMLLVVLIKSILNLSKQKEWSKGDIKLTAILMGFTHLQALVGLVMYFFVHQYYKLFSEMANPDIRWKVIEHPMMMIFFIALITMMHSINKKADKKNKSRRAIIFTLLSAILVVLAIPLSRW